MIHDTIAKREFSEYIEAESCPITYEIVFRGPKGIDAMFSIRSIYLPYSVLLVFLATPWLCAAKPPSTSQPIHVEADRATIDDKKGISVYSGNVRIQHGSLKILADKLTITTKNNALSKVEAVGKPASFEQRAEDTATVTKGKADKMEYSAAKQTILLLNNATIQQGRNTFQSDRISYNMVLDQVDASNRNGSGRVKITIQPESLETTDRNKK